MSVAPDDPSFLDRLRGVLSSPHSADLGLALLANSGYSSVPRPFGQVAAQSALMAQQMEQQRAQDDIKKRYMEAQIQALQAKPLVNQPASVLEYEYAVRNGFKGSFQDWQNQAKPANDPADVSTYKYFAGLAPDQQKQFLQLKRNVGSDYAIENVNGVPTVVYKPAAGGNSTTPLMTPLTSLPQQVSAESQLAGAKAQSTAVGAAAGEQQGSVLKRGATANTVLGMLDVAEPLIDASTGSVAGAAADKLAAVFGKAPKGAQAAAQLQVIQAGLMLNMPRMEGPQSDRDVQLYRQSAGQIGDPNVPNTIKKAAVQTIRQLQEKYKDAASQVPQVFPNGSPEAQRGDIEAEMRRRGLLK